MIALKYSNILVSSQIIIFILLAFVLLAALRFNTFITHLTIFIATLIAFFTLILNFANVASDVYEQAVFTLKIGLIPMALGGLFVASAFSESDITLSVELEQISQPRSAHIIDLYQRAPVGMEVLIDEQG